MNLKKYADMNVYEIHVKCFDIDLTVTVIYIFFHS